MGVHECPDCTHDVDQVIGELAADVAGTDAPTNEHDVAIAEAAAEAAVDIARIEADAGVEREREYTAQAEARAAAEIAETEAAAEVATTAIEAAADVEETAIETEGAIVEAEIAAEAGIVETEIEAAEPHDEPDGDEVVDELPAAAGEPVGVEVPPQLKDEAPSSPAPARGRTTSAFRRHRMRAR